MTLLKFMTKHRHSHFDGIFMTTAVLLFSEQKYLIAAAVFIGGIFVSGVCEAMARSAKPTK